MIKTKAELKDWLAYEGQHYQGSTGLVKYFAGSEKAIIWHFQKRLRQTEYYLNSNKKILYAYSIFLLNHQRNKYGLNISLNTCERGLKIMHLGPILVNGKAKIGKDCALHINTALVANGVTSDAPILEQGVVVGVGAVILGGVHIAKNVAIGANAVVTRDIDEENIAVAGVPARKVSQNGRLEWNKKLGSDLPEL